MYEKFLFHAEWRRVETTPDHIAALYLARTRVSSRGRTQMLTAFFFSFLDLGTDLSRGPSPRSGKCHCRFHRAIRNWLVTSNWRRRYSEYTCGTMNSDPLTTPTSTTTTTTIAWRGSRGGRVQRGGGRMYIRRALVLEAGERPLAALSCWHFSSQGDTDILRRHWHCDQRSDIASQQRSITTMEEREIGKLLTKKWTGWQNSARVREKESESRNGEAAKRCVQKVGYWNRDQLSLYRILAEKIAFDFMGTNVTFLRPRLIAWRKW